MEKLEQIQKNPEVLSPEQLHTIARAYDLPPLHFLHSPEAGIITDNAILEAEDGTRYFAKLYDSVDEEKHTSIYRAAELLAANPLIPVSLPFLSKDGTYTVDVAGRPLALFSYVPHRAEPPQTEAEEAALASSMAVNLGRMHAVEVPKDDPLLRPIGRWQEEARTTRTSMLERVIKHIHTLEKRDQFDELALESATTKLSLIQSLPEPDWDALDLNICHADYHGHNVLYDEDMNVVAIFDWDNAGLADKYMDFVNTFAMTVIGHRFDSYQEDRFEIARAVCEQYQEGLGQQIDMSHLRTAYDALMHERIGTSWPVFQHYFSGHTRNDNRVEPVLRKAKFHAENYEEMWDFIERAATERHD
ncbi:MAG: phosphotransferase [Candidatus Paceibacterota bacterium]